MDGSFKTGLSFGITSGIITTLGLMVGLDSSTNSRLAVIGGVLVIAIADALSDALGIHISEESEKKSDKSIWESTLSTFVSKFIIALTFIVPLLIFSLQTAVIISVLWGLLLLGLLSFSIAKSKGANPLKAISEHITIAVVVVIITFFLGKAINYIFS
jgi:VIT1/CCC1 family predicted Fe2+/Mn2+ transporter